MRPSIKISLLLLLWLTIGSATYAQDIDYTQYFLNNAAYNPGFSGFEDYVDTKVGFRQGWNSFGIANNYLFASLNSGLNSTKRAAVGSNSLRISNPDFLKEISSGRKIRRKHGIGGMIAARNLGPYKQTTLSVNYAYHMPISRNLNLSFGSRVGMQNQRLNLTGYQVRDEVNDLFYQELMRSGQGTTNSVIVDFGSVLYSKKFTFGVSSMNLVRSEMSGPQLIESSARRIVLVQAALTDINIGTNLNFTPGMMMAYTVDSNTSLNINGRLAYKKLVYIGGAYGTIGKKFSGLFGLRLDDRLTVGYSFDRYLSHSGNFNTTVHEFVAGIVMFNKHGVKPKLW